MHMLKGTVTKRKKFRLAALSLVCAAAMLTAPWSAYATSNGSSAASGSSSSSKDQLAALNSQQADLKKQQDALNAKISQAKSELEKQQLIKENSSYQITLTKQQIDLLEDKIVLINENIDEKETEIAEKEEEISQTQNKIDENYELLKKRLRSMYTTGRSSTPVSYTHLGFVLITDDGQLAHRILSPRSHVPKTYFVEVDGPISPAVAQDFADGMAFKSGERCMSASLEIGPAGNQGVVILQEGMYHQIKRMFLKHKLTVTHLIRVKMGGLELDPNLKPGECREITSNELAKLLCESDE